MTTYDDIIQYPQSLIKINLFFVCKENLLGFTLYIMGYGNSLFIAKGFIGSRGYPSLVFSPLLGSLMPVGLTFSLLVGKAPNDTQGGLGTSVKEFIPE